MTDRLLQFHKSGFIRSSDVRAMWTSYNPTRLNILTKTGAVISVTYEDCQITEQDVNTFVGQWRYDVEETQPAWYKDFMLWFCLACYFTCLFMGVWMSH
jgi:hypothetical protein